jgi:hypothetical protein
LRGVFVIYKESIDFWDFLWYDELLPLKQTTERTTNEKFSYQAEQVQSGNHSRGCRGGTAYGIRCL